MDRRMGGVVSCKSAAISRRRGPHALRSLLPATLVPKVRMSLAELLVKVTVAFAVPVTLSLVSVA